MTMAEPDFTHNPTNVHPERVSSADFRHASDRKDPNAIPDAQPDAEEGERMMRSLEEALEKERTRLMAANSMLGCIQTALDPEAIEVSPPVYFPEVLELAREMINRSVIQLEYDQIRRVLYSPKRRPN
jgi:hypothetical protein